ncbi:hypothetical protein ACFQ51_55155 [Streptomyces kaempferi]
MGAASLFGHDVIRIAHTETARLLTRAADPNRPLPTITFRDTHRVKVGGEVLDLAYHGPNHSPDNIFIHAPEYNTLMLVDVLYPGWVPFKNLAVSQDIPEWVKAQHIAMDYPWHTFVGGHLGRLGTRTDGTLQIQYMNDLDASTRSAIATVDPTPYFAKYGTQGNSWAIFKTFLDAVADTAATPVATKYAASSPPPTSSPKTTPGPCSNPSASTPASSDPSASDPEPLEYHPTVRTPELPVP